MNEPLIENSLLLTILMLFVVQELTTGISPDFARLLNRTARVGIPVLVIAYAALIAFRLLGHSV
ncbi:MAG: hypothetical protein ABI700_26290 [Chloroflexota bacterium]